MSRKLLIFLLSELRTVRLVCKNNVGGQECQAATEMSIAQMCSQTEHVCKACRAVIFRPDRGSPVVNLANAVRAMQQHSETNAVDLEFVLPDNG